MAELHVQIPHPLNGPNLKWQSQEGKACNDRQHHKVAMMRYAPAKGQSAKQLCHLIHPPQGCVCLCQGSLIASACKYFTLADWKTIGVRTVSATALTWSEHQTDIITTPAQLVCTHSNTLFRGPCRSGRVEHAKPAQTIIPSDNPKSPTRFTNIAFIDALDALDACSLVNQKIIKR